MTTKFEILLTVPLLAAITGIGGNIMIHLLIERAKATSQQQHIGFIGEQSDWIGNRFFIGSAIVLLGTGIWMVADLEGYEFSQFWISYSLTILLLSFIVGATFLGPQGKKLGQMMETEPPGSPAVQAQFGKVLTVGRIELFFLLTVVVVMATKPGFG